MQAVRGRKGSTDCQLPNILLSAFGKDQRLDVNILANRAGKAANSKCVKQVMYALSHCVAAERIGGRIGQKQHEVQNDIPEDMICPNCKEHIKGINAVAHTIQCYRNSTKCRVCNQVVHKDMKKQHLDKWRNHEVSYGVHCRDF